MPVDHEIFFRRHSKIKAQIGEIREGEVLFIEKSPRGDVLYINGFNRVAYRVHERKVIER